jgi:hypothetical protein
MKQTTINPLRVAGTTVLMFGVCAGLVAAVRLSDSVAVALAAGIPVTLIPASIYEWLVHRYVYHREQAGPLAQIYRIHHKGHHAAIFPTWRYTTNGSVRRHPVSEPDISQLYPAGWRNLISKAAHFLFYMVLGSALICTPVWLLTGNRWFLLSSLVTLVVISDLFVRVHDAIHYPGQFRFIEAQPWYPFIDRHHFIHHVDMEANVNFLLPLADWCYGTMRTSLTEAEIVKHGTLKEAKASPIGNSEPASVFAAEIKKNRRARLVPTPDG